MSTPTEVDALLAAPWAGLRCFHEWEREATIVAPCGGAMSGGYVRGLCSRPGGAMFVGLRSQPTLLLSLRGAMFAARKHSPALYRLRTQPLNIAKKVLCLWGYDRNGFLAVYGA